MTVFELFMNIDKITLKNRLSVLHPGYFNDKDIDIFYDDIQKNKTSNLNDNEFENYKDFVILVNKVYDDNVYDKIDTYDLDINKFSIDQMVPEKCEMYYNVDGIHLSQLKNNHKVLSYDFNEIKKIDNWEENGVITYGLDFIPRKIILNLNIAQPSIDIFGLIDVAVEIFWEMTFYGLTENQIQNEADKVFDRLDMVKDNSNENNFVNLDDLFLDLDIDKNKIDFSIKVSNKINEFNHDIQYKFLKEVYEWSLKI